MSNEIREAAKRLRKTSARSLMKSLAGMYENFSGYRKCDRFTVASREAGVTSIFGDPFAGRAFETAANAQVFS